MPDAAGLIEKEEVGSRDRTPDRITERGWDAFPRQDQVTLHVDIGYERAVPAWFDQPSVLVELDDEP